MLYHFTTQIQFLQILASDQRMLSRMGDGVVMLQHGMLVARPLQAVFATLGSTLGFLQITPIPQQPSTTSGPVTSSIQQSQRHPGASRIRSSISWGFGVQLPSAAAAVDPSMW